MSKPRDGGRPSGALPEPPGLRGHDFGSWRTSCRAAADHQRSVGGWLPCLLAKSHHMSVTWNPTETRLQLPNTAQPSWIWTSTCGPPCLNVRCSSRKSQPPLQQHQMPLPVPHLPRPAMAALCNQQPPLKHCTCKARAASRVCCRFTRPGLLTVCLTW